jgi:uncharacterized protein YecE (DUF72 family)
MTGRIVVGTGGWSAEEWYPPGMPARDRLGWYAERFEGVEVDSTFYALPARRTVARWATVTPDGFTFDIKLHRLLSRHAAPPSSLPRDLRRRAEVNERGRVILSPELEEAVCRRTLEAMAPLLEADAVTSFLLQLTPAFAPAEHRLDELEPVVQALAPVPVAIELRHRDWLNDSDATLDGFKSLGAAVVCVDAPAVDAPIVLPPFDAVSRRDLAYLRAHGRNAKGYLRGRSAGERFAWEYSDDELHELADRARRLADTAATVRLMLTNAGHAMAAARRMREILAADP